MINKIRMKNWKSHLDTELSFSKGVNCLVGVMGSGKTSVMQAISFALFGNFPSLQSRRLSISDMIMKKPKQMDKAEVEIEFMVDDNTYSVKRIVGEKGTLDAEIRRNGKILEVNSKRVTEEVEKILQMDYALFSKAVYSEQDGMDYFLRIPKGKRMDHIDNLLHVERFARSRDNSVTAVNKIKMRIDEKMHMISDVEKEGLEEKITNMTREFSEFETKKRQILAELDVARRKKQELATHVEEHRTKEEEVQRLHIQIKGLQGKLDEINDSIEIKKGFIQAKKDADLKKTIEEMRKILKERKDQLEEKKKRHHEINVRLRIVTESRVKIHDLDNKCPLCESDITGDRKTHLLKERDEEIEKLSKEIPDSSNKIEELKENIDKIETNLRLHELDYDRLDEYKKEIVLQESRVIEISMALEEIKKRLKDTKLPDITKIQKEYEDFISRESSLSSELRSFNERMMDKKLVLEELVNRQKMIDNYKREIKVYEITMKQFQTFSNVLKLTQNQLREHFLGAVNSTMGQIWQDLYPYGDFSNVRLVVESPKKTGSKDYILQLQDATGWISADGVASGGERSIACLALRIAFSLTFIPNLKWLILDEPTHNLDKHAIEQFSSILRERLGEFADQVFLITHEEGLSSSITGSLYKLERNKRSDQPTQVVL